MTRAYVCLIILFGVLSGPVGCREPHRSFQSFEKDANKSDNNSQSAETSVSTQEPALIYLAVGSFDPLRQTSPVQLPQELTLQRYPEDGTGYYILQFKGPVLQRWKEEVASAGVEIFDYIPQFAFLVKMDSLSRRRVEAMDAVRWLGIYQPGYRIAPDLMSQREKKETQSIELLVSIFKGEDISLLRSRLEALGGESIEVAPGEKKIKLAISSNRIEDVARLSGVRYIEKAPEFKLSPSYIKKRGK